MTSTVDGKEVDYFPFLVAREAFFFAVDLSTYLLASIVHIYCNKIITLCTIPLKKLAISSPHNYEVRVLLHELYPEQGQVLGANAFHRSDVNNADEYMLALQKIGLDDVGDLLMDEISFLFQTNHLPISVFQSTPTNDSEIEQSSVCVAGCSSAEGTSFASSQCQHATNALGDVQQKTPVTVSEPQTRLTCAKNIAKPEDIKANNMFTAEADDIVLRFVQSSENMNISPIIPQKVNKTRTSSGSATSFIADDSNSCSYKSCYSPHGTASNASDILSDSLPVSNRYNRINHTKTFASYRKKRYSTESSSSSCGEESSFLQDINALQPTTCAQLFNGPLSEKSFTNKQPIVNRKPLLNNQHPWKPVLKSLSNQMSNQTLQSNKPPTPVWPKFEKLNSQYTTETFLDPTHFDDTDDDDDSDISEGEHSSDSELYHRPSLQIPYRRDCCFKLEQSSDSMRALSCGSATRSNFYCDCSDCFGALDSCYPIDISDSEHGDRHVRDVNILDRLKVPYSYDEVAYSSNDHFRDIKSTPGLSIDQITAMLDARRRATNRQAAERCRRVKSAARNSLATQLDRLRMERAALLKRLIRTRKRRQHARDELASAQTSFIKVLIGPDGNSLDPSKWRLQTTAQGELVVVRSATES